MPEYPAFLIDAFTKERLAGNQAAVCLIDKLMLDDDYQKLAAEFNLSETAYPEPLNGNFRTASNFNLRWFTPKVEVDLCGHATLATSHVLFYEIENHNSTITFNTRSGPLHVSKESNNMVKMDFPEYFIESIRFEDEPNKLENIFGERDAPCFVLPVIECVIHRNIRVEYVGYAPMAKKLIVAVDPNTTRDQFLKLSNDYKRMTQIHPEGDFIRGLIVTFQPANAAAQGFTDSSGIPYDYVCRYFAPWAGIDEDPATGSAQCAIAPFWKAITGKDTFYAYQCFPNRGAEFHVKVPGDGRVSLVGNSITVLKGIVMLDV